MSTSLEGRIDIRLERRGEVVTKVAIHSSRPQLAQRLMAGRSPEEAADLAGLIFSLCGKAQGLAARRAGQAARGQGIVDNGTGPVLVEMAQEHAWRLLLNWPEQAGRSPDMESLLGLRQSAADPVAFAAVLDGQLETVFLGEPASVWLARDIPAFDQWRHQGRTLVARLFADLGEGPDSGIARSPLLPSLGHLQAAQAEALARQALADPAFAAAPRWQGLPAETGALARTAGHPLLAGWLATRGRGAGARLLARLVELAGLPDRLVQSGGEQGRAAEGASSNPVVRAWALEDNVGMAGVETSRGLLLHVLRLEQDRVADYRIIAPTEWNFHPTGPLAQALEGLAVGADLDARARLVAQSLDPCVAYGVELNDA